MTSTIKNAKHTQLQEICFYLVNGCMTQEVERYQEEIRGFLLTENDLVKKIIVDTLSNSHSLPKEIALQLAHDKFIYAKNILEHYPGFLADDLTSIIKSIGPGKVNYLMAVTTRKNLPTEVLQEIIDNCSYENLLKIL